MESRCKDIQKYFKSSTSFKGVCDLLGINPSIIESIEQEINLENETKTQENELIQIGNDNYHKSYFIKNVTRVIKNNDITVEITRQDDMYHIHASNKYGSNTTLSAQLDDKIIINGSDSKFFHGIRNLNNIISNGQVNISI